MTQEEIRRLEDIISIFKTPGWKHIIEDFQEDFEQVSSIFDVSNMEQLFKNKGKLAAILKVLTYEETVRRIYEDAEAA